MSVVIDGTAGITFPDTSVQAKSQTGPAFSAAASAGQSLTTNTWTKIQLPTIVFDTALAFDNVTNYRFRPLVAGYYQINGAVSNGAFVGGVAAGAIYKNGASVAKSTITNGGQGTINTASVTVYLNGSTDYVELWGYQSSGGALSTFAADTVFSGFLARAA